MQPVISGESSLLIDKAKKQSITREIQLEPEVAAPVSQGQRLGTLTLRSGDEVLAEIPLLAESAVPRLTWREIFMALLGRVCMASEKEPAE